MSVFVIILKKIEKFQKIMKKKGSSLKKIGFLKK